MKAVPAKPGGFRGGVRKYETCKIADGDVFSGTGWYQRTTVALR